MSNLIIRNEEKRDYAQVERITREAFWNLYVPGCAEHYLAHILREHEDFIPELDFVAELDGQVIGNVMYTKSTLIGGAGEKKEILTFGPLCILPGYQRRGYGKRLLERSFEKAVELGYEVIVIFGDPDNYVSRGFKSCHKYNVCLEKDVFPCAMLVKELKPGALDGRRWYYYDSPAFQFSSEEVEAFDALFEAKEKKYQPSQEAFYILSNSVIQAVSD